MSHGPFPSDPAVPARLAALADDHVAALRATAAGALVAPAGETAGGIIPAATAADIVDRFDLSSTRELMLLLLDLAQKRAHPPISNFHVGAVGLEAETGNLILGGNIEFPGTHLGYTLHAEGFVATRAMSRGTNLSVIALGEAHPCAHCRQCLAEYAASDRLELIDPLGHTLTLAQLYPWPFDPACLGERGAVPGRNLWPDLHFIDTPGIADAAPLLAAGRRSHTPYSKCPAAIVLTLADGTAVTGLAIESVAFNPTIQPLHAAVVDLIAHGYTYRDIATATLGTVAGGAVDYARATAELLAAIAPGAPLAVLPWRP